MLKQFATRSLLALVIVAASLLSGCISLDSLDLDFPGLLQENHELVVMPDGSGRMTVTAVMLFEDPKSNTKEELAAAFADLADEPLDDSIDGAVGFEVRFVVPCDGALEAAYTVYFEDVNRFACNLDDADSDSRVTFRYRQLPEGFVLEINDPEPSDVAELFADWSPDQAPVPYWKAIAEAPIEGEDPDGAKRAAKAFAQKVIEGPRLLHTYTLPGAINEAGGATSVEGRTTAFLIARDERKGLEGAKVAAKPEKDRRVRRIVCGPSVLSDEALAAFRQELAEAKAAYARRREP